MRTPLRFTLTCTKYLYLQSVLMIFKNDVFCRSDVSGALGTLLGVCLARPVGPWGPPEERIHCFVGPRGVLWSDQGWQHDDLGSKSCIGFESFVFRLLRLWERLGRFPKAWFAAKEVPGTPSEKMNSDFGAKMGRRRHLLGIYKYRKEGKL